MSEAAGIPVYIITGFLDSGKTKFINEMLGDPGFSEGERTLILRCEQGEEEYDPKLLKAANAIVRDLDEPEDMQEKLIRYDKEFRPERIIFEYNATWMLSALYDAPKPEDWELAQIVDMIDASTFEVYLTNMRTFMTDGINEADLVLFNRCDENTPKSRFRRTAKALNNTTRVYFDNLDGTTDDGVSDEDLPYDMSADPIVIPDDLFGIWYLDSMEHPERYDGRRLKMKGQAVYTKGLPNKCYVFSRLAMTCCAADIGGIGYVCRTSDKLPDRNTYVEAVVKAERAFSPIHNQEALILVEQSRTPAEKPAEEVVTFNN